MLACRPEPVEPRPACATEAPPAEERRDGAVVPEVRLEGDWELEIRHTLWVMQADEDPCAEVVVGQTRSNAHVYHGSYDPPERVLVLEPPLPADGFVATAGRVLARSDVRQDEDTGGLYSYGNFGQGVVIDVPGDLLLVAAPGYGDEFDVGAFPLSRSPASTWSVGASFQATTTRGAVARALGRWTPARPGLLWLSGWDTVDERAFAGDFYFVPVSWEGSITERDAGATLGCDPGDLCGESAATDDDLDGDLVPDLAFGGYWRAPGGRVGVVTRLRDGAHRLWDEAATIIDGETEGGYFGGHVSTGDLDGDRRAELLVGAPYEGEGDGAVYVFRGPLPAGTLRPGEADWVVRGAAPIRVVGQSADVGDLDGDGAPELIVAAPANPRLFPDPGVVLVFRGPVAPGAYEPADADLTVVHRQEGPADGFGWPVSAGDLDGDGLDDLVLGATDDRDDQGRPAGSVQVLFGRPDLFRR